MSTDEEKQIEEIKKITKRGFDPRERLKRRGLRKATITVFLDEEGAGPELGWAYNGKPRFDGTTERIREGVLGELDTLREDQEKILAAREEPSDEPTGLEERIAELEAERDRLVAELTRTGLTFHLRAVPPVIQRDVYRKAKQTLGIKGKSIPDDVQEEFNDAQTAHLMAAMIQSVTDNETGAVNYETTYEDAVAYMEELPPGQWARLDELMGKLQFTDAISREIEGQEDFS